MCNSMSDNTLGLQHCKYDTEGHNTLTNYKIILLDYLTDYNKIL